MKNPRILIEVCIDSVASAVAAWRGGANRVELCQGLFEGGLTPSAGLIKRVRAAIPIGVFVIIRPRSGDFFYSKEEFEIMKEDVATAKSLGADGIVLGILTRDGKVDRKRCAQLIQLARPLPVTFHRAFDMAKDPAAALEDVIALGCERLLTSGQEKSVWEGIDLLASLVRQAKSRIIVMPGGGITETNFPKVVKASGAREFHTSGSIMLPSTMSFKNGRVFMGRELRPPEYATWVVDPQRIARFCQAAEKI